MVVRRMLSCGVNFKEFDTARKNLSDEQQKIIYNIARRMWVTHILRYLTEVKVSVFGPNERAQLELFDIPALEVYLLFTCIDTLANKDYRNFYQWLKGQVGKDEALNLETIKMLYYKQYEPAKGIGANIRRLLENLPEQTKQWLSEHIKVQKLDRRIANGEHIDVDDGNVFVEVQNIDKVVREIYEYFYKIRRNPFTHQSQSFQTYREEDIEIGDRWRFTPTTDYYRTDKKYTYSLRIKEGLDEATILRVIIQSAVLQEMKIPVQAATIREYIFNQSRLCAVYGFLKEIQQNSLYLRWLSGFDENGISELNNLIHQVITNAEQVTPEWLTRILYEKGYPSRSNVISVQKVNRSRRTATWFADISFLEVSYSGKAPKSAPNRLFLKISKPSLKPADLLCGRKEVEFYNTIANAMDAPPLARCYDAVYSPDTGRSHILLDDLSETHFQPQHPLPPSRLDCELAMDSLARFHAHWWEHPRLGMDIGKLFNRETPNIQNLASPHSLRETEEMFTRFVGFLGDRLSVTRRRLYEQVLSSWPFSRLSERLNERRGITLIHRDAHAWNFLYPRDPEHDGVRIIDWHEWGIGLGTNDLTEMIVLWWYPERRARMEESLVKRYHRQLTEHGVEGYDWEQCWDDYRLSASRILLYPVWMYAEERPPTFWWPVLERGILAFQDLECVELLE